MTQNIYSVQVGIQWLLDRPFDMFRVQTLATSERDAEANIRERFRQAYALRIDEVKRGA